MLNTISRNESFDSLYVAGFSLGGNMLLKWLGENPGQTQVAKAVAVSPPFDLAVSSRVLDSGVSRIYRNAILRKLRVYLQGMQDIVSSKIDYPAAISAGTFLEYDNQVTAPLNGFRDAEEYYSKSSCRQFLVLIDTPVLIVHSRDDPFSTPEAIPGEDELGDGVVLELSDRGGHVGFVGSGPADRGGYWLPGRITAYFSAP